MHNIKAIIFDMDGVISDTQRLHTRVERAVFAEYGIDITEKEIAFLYAGTKDMTQFSSEFKKRGITASPKEAYDKKWAEMSKLTNKDFVAISGIEDLLKRIKKDFVLAVASGTATDFVTRILKAIHLYDYFAAVVGGDKVSEGKPNPELFLHAAEMLKVKPESCVIIEDAPNGIKAAHNAGMKCIAITTTHTPEEIKDADKIINSYSELTSDAIQSL